MSQLPLAQPARGVVVVLGYLVVAAAGLLALPAAFGNIGYVFAAFLGAAGLLPVAILAPRLRGQAPDGPTTPVLQRTRAARAPDPPTAR